MKIVRVLGLLILVPTFSAGEEYPILLEDTKILHLPVLEYRVGGSSLFFQVDLQGSSDFSTFIPILAIEVEEPMPIENSSISTHEIHDRFEGVLSAFETGSEVKIGPFESCPPIPFNPGSTDVVVDSNSGVIDIEIDVFPDLFCRLNGTINADSAEGTFECSNINSGTWLSNLMKENQSAQAITMSISFSGESCSFDTTFTGLKN